MTEIAYSFLIFTVDSLWISLAVSSTLNNSLLQTASEIHSESTVKIVNKLYSIVYTRGGHSGTAPYPGTVKPYPGTAPY